MKKMFLVALAVSACVCGLAPVSSARQQQGARQRRGGLDNFSLPAAGAGPSVPAGWQVFEPPGAGFSVAAPAGLAEAPVEGRIAPQHRAEMRKYKVVVGGVDYGVGRSGAILRMMEPAQYYASARGMLIAKGGAPSGKRDAKMELTRERAVVLDGHEGREFELVGDGRKALTRLYLIEGALFTLAVEGLAASFPEEKAQVFFESFRLTARQ